MIKKILKVVEPYCMKIQHIMKLEEIVALKDKEIEIADKRWKNNEHCKKEMLDMEIENKLALEELLESFPKVKGGLNNYTWQKEWEKIDKWQSDMKKKYL